MGKQAKQTRARTDYFFHDKPVFGLDIGHGSLKVMQIDANKTGRPLITGYGTTQFDSSASDNGVIVKPEAIAEATKELFAKHLIGRIDTKRVALSIPTYRSFSRSILLPKLKPKEMAEAVSSEIEQYVPMPMDDLYYDWHITRQDPEQTELFAVAIPRDIVDSYQIMASLMGLEAVLVETTMGAAARLFSKSKFNDVATVIIDFGSLTSDISIYHGAILVTSTVKGGGVVFSQSIQSALGVNAEEAGIIKNRYGLAPSKKQALIRSALEPVLQDIIKELKRLMRYYEERYGNQQKIGQVVILGGGANMPGLADYLTEQLRLPTRAHDPWAFLNYHGLQPPAGPDKLMYATVAGLALLDPKEAFN